MESHFVPFKNKGGMRYREKSRGQSINPCGTPHETKAEDDLKSKGLAQNVLSTR